MTATKSTSSQKAKASSLDMVVLGARLMFMAPVGKRRARPLLRPTAKCRLPVRMPKPCEPTGSSWALPDRLSPQVHQEAPFSYIHRRKRPTHGSSPEVYRDSASRHSSCCASNPASLVAIHDHPISLPSAPGRQRSLARSHCGPHVRSPIGNFDGDVRSCMPAGWHGGSRTSGRRRLAAPRRFRPRSRRVGRCPARRRLGGRYAGQRSQGFHARGQAGGTRLRV